MQLLFGIPHNWIYKPSTINAVKIPYYPDADFAETITKMWPPLPIRYKFAWAPTAERLTLEMDSECLGLAKMWENLRGNCSKLNPNPLILIRHSARRDCVSWWQKISNFGVKCHKSTEDKYVEGNNWVSLHGEQHGSGNLSQVPLERQMASSKFRHISTGTAQERKCVKHLWVRVGLCLSSDGLLNAGRRLHHQELHVCRMSLA